jgi:hypothetical protein
MKIISGNAVFYLSSSNNFYQHSVLIVLPYQNALLLRNVEENIWSYKLMEKITQKWASFAAIRMIKSRRMRLARYVALTGKIKMFKTFWLENPKGRPRRPGFDPRSGYVWFVVDKVALGQVFSEYFGFPCQSSFHQLLHNHLHLSSGAGTIGQQWPTYQVDSVSPHPEKLKKKLVYVPRA